MAKYTTYQQLAEAFQSGELGPHYHLMLDKSGTQNSLNYYDPKASDAVNERYQEGCRNLFDFDDTESTPIESACAALGIPFKWS